MKSLVPTVLKSTIFIVITVAATGLLLLSVANSGGGGHGYRALFTDATSLRTGDDVRMAGVRIGTVTSISVADRREAAVGFTVDPGMNLASTVTATIRYRNLVGQRYVSLDQGSGSPSSHWPAGRTLPLSRTTPALDLTALFNGFQPLFQALDGNQINRFSYEIIQVFQGEGATVDDLLTRTASLTTTLADRDAVIGRVIDNLNSVLKTVNARRAELNTTILTLKRLVSGLAADRGAIGSAISGLGGLTQSVSSLLRNGRPALQRSIDSLGALSSNLAKSTPAVNSFLQNLPTKLNKVGRLASYGSWVNFYVCSLGGRIPTLENERYTGGRGVANPAARCER